MTPQIPSVEWGWQKAILLFLGLLAGGIATVPAPQFKDVEMLKWIAAVLWFAFHGSFFWLLKPPAQQGQSASEGDSDEHATDPPANQEPR